MHNLQPLKCRYQPPSRSTTSIIFDLEIEPSDDEKKPRISRTVRRRKARLRKRNKELNPQISKMETVLVLTQNKETFKVPRATPFESDLSKHDAEVLRARGASPIELEYHFKIFFPKSQFDLSVSNESYSDDEDSKPEKKKNHAGFTFKGYYAEVTPYNFIHLGLVDRMNARKFIMVIPGSHIEKLHPGVWDHYVGELPDFIGILMLDFEICGQKSRAPFIVSHLVDRITIGSSWTTEANVISRFTNEGWVIMSCEKPVYQYPYFK
ncbi:uncharacterized protein SAPINGB_P002565 [Magnusiomyces paraingens]|uniref:Uncharacterized protein n=1 Tax=Magnusiomyces paraingens TaxID=2606893 RepID=A0A5E8BEU0_9ASCO|nr:uncharacterized protein SAPINGB_P002565 [Saprochaete ingens]VVT50029.1 unnamed protein product [Saprochaete ingens]